MNDPQLPIYFNQLLNTNETVRIEAAKNIYDTLLGSTHLNSGLPKRKLSKEIISEQPFTSKFGSDVTEDLDYCLKRLIKGTTSSTSTIQLSFGFPLVEILKKFDQISFEKYLKFINQECNIKKTIKKSEEKHFIFGKLLCMLALAEAGRLDHDQSNFSQNITIFYDSLLETMVQFPWSQEACVNIISVTLLKSNFKIKEKLKALQKKVKALLGQNSYRMVELLHVLMIAYSKTKEAFPFEQIIEDKILNHNNLKTIISDSIEIFPKSHQCIRSIINILRFYVKNNDNPKQFWEGFWNFFTNEYIIQISEQNNRIKYYFLILSLLKEFIKHKDFSFTDLTCINNEELLQLWMRNLNVKNIFLKELALKIQSQLIQKLTNLKEIVMEETNQSIFLNFICTLKNQPLLRFKKNHQFANCAFSLFNQNSLSLYLKFLRKKSIKSKRIQTKLFYMNEIFIVQEQQIHNFNSKQCEEILNYFLIESNKQKIEDYLTKEKEFLAEEYNNEKEEVTKTEIQQVQEQILNLFYSILNSEIRRKGKKKEKSIVWRGMHKDNEHILFKIAKFAIEHSEKYAQANKHKKIRLKYFKKSEEIQQEMLSHSQFTKKQEDQLFGLNLKQLMIFHQLWNSILIQSFQTPEESFEQLEDLQQAYIDCEKYFIEKHKFLAKEKEQIRKKVQLNNDRKFLTVFTEIFIQLLTKSHLYLREITKRCFSQFANELQVEQIEIITSVLVKNNDEFLQEMEEDEQE